MTVDVRFNGRLVPVSNEMFNNFRDLAVSSGLRESYMNITGEFNMNSRDQLVEHPIDVVVGRNAYNTPAQYHELFAHIMLDHELRQPARVRFMADTLRSIETAHLPLFSEKRLIRSVDLGLTDAFCARNGLNEAEMRRFRRIGIDRFSGFFDHVPKVTSGIPRTGFTVFADGKGVFHDDHDDTYTFIEMPGHQEQVFDHPAFTWFLVDERLAFLEEHGMLDFYDLTFDQRFREFGRSAEQLKLKLGK